MCVCACVLSARALGRQIPRIWANCRSAAKQECHSGRNCNCGPGANKRLFELPVQGWGQWQFSSLDTDPNSTHEIYPQINSLLFCRCSAFFIEKSHISWHLLYLCVLCLCPVSEPPPTPPEMRKAHASLFFFFACLSFQKHALKCRTGKTADKKKNRLAVLQYSNTSMHWQRHILCKTTRLSLFKVPQHNKAQKKLDTVESRKWVKFRF